VSDFDMTMTKYYVNGSRGCTCHGKLINKCNNFLILSLSAIAEDGGELPSSYTAEVIKAFSLHPEYIITFRHI